MSKIYYIINYGIEMAPMVGLSGSFHPHMWVGERKAWEDAVKKTRADGRYLHNFYNCGDNCPCGDVKIVHKDNYIYMYVVNERGDWDSMFFTHEVIGG